MRHNNWWMGRPGRRGLERGRIVYLFIYLFIYDLFRSQRTYKTCITCERDKINCQNDA